ncbi:hypothetical protein J6590_034694 [Homalodisca vitripennis]|nr:hypothetical protein J6590_094188 [Homalodisca vitripennis]KAG8302381.1 hypothetical protein J6590_034694 [Homalodisca vitripennis]
MEGVYLYVFCGLVPVNVKAPWLQHASCVTRHNLSENKNLSLTVCVCVCVSWGVSLPGLGGAPSPPQLILGKIFVFRPQDNLEPLIWDSGHSSTRTLGTENIRHWNHWALTTVGTQDTRRSEHSALRTFGTGTFGTYYSWDSGHSSTRTLGTENIRHWNHWALTTVGTQDTRRPEHSALITFGTGIIGHLLQLGLSWDSGHSSIRTLGTENIRHWIHSVLTTVGTQDTRRSERSAMRIFSIDVSQRSEHSVLTVDTQNICRTEHSENSILTTLGIQNSPVDKKVGT